MFRKEGARPVQSPQRFIRLLPHRMRHGRTDILQLPYALKSGGFRYRFSGSSYPPPPRRTGGVLREVHHGVFVSAVGWCGRTAERAVSEFVGVVGAVMVMVLVIIFNCRAYRGFNISRGACIILLVLHDAKPKSVCTVLTFSLGFVTALYAAVAAQSLYRVSFRVFVSLITLALAIAVPYFDHVMGSTGGPVKWAANVTPILFVKLHGWRAASTTDKLASIVMGTTE
ncbi:hypothetical protein L0F63_007274, partial [Massospora cicadina]